jgi:hypothetical protein
MKRFISLLTICFVLVAFTSTAQAFDLTPDYTVEQMLTVPDMVETTTAVAEQSFMDAQTALYETQFYAVPDIKSEEQAKFSKTYDYQDPENKIHYTKHIDRWRNIPVQSTYISDRLLC